MQCPDCGREMRRLSKFWVCEEHAPPVAIPIRTTPTETVHPYSELCSQLPTPIAVPIDEFGKWAENKSPMLAYRALWAMVDAAELITRFIAIVAMLDVRQQTGEIPEPLRKVLVNVLERPTFGAWRDIAHSAIEKLGTSTLVQELPDFWKQHWGPLFEGGSAEQSIIELRNRMAHTARLTDEEAQSLLDAHCERFEKAICALNFWASYRLIAVLSDGRAVRLHGVPDPEGWVLPEESNLPTDLSAYRERVVLLSQDGLELLVLFPLQLYNPVLVVREGHHEIVDDRPAPMVYMRYNRQRQLLEYTALAPNYAFSQQQFREAFNELFPLSEWRRKLEQQQAARTEWEQEGYHFRDLIDNLTEELYGRAAHLEQVKQRLQQHCESGGVLWIGGRPGVGKSALMAKLAKDLQGDSRVVLIPFFFRSGDHRCGADRFYRAACLRLAEQLRISLERKPNQRYADLFSEVMQRVSDALPDDKTVIFLLDGLDEGVRHEPDLPEIPLRYQSPRVVWICAGRREKSLRALRDTEATQKLWGDGELPPLTHDDIRAWLQNELERLRYELFELDRLDGDELRNKFIEELTLRSEGLPLYVRMVIEDLKTRQFTVWDGDRLPQGLERYYDHLLERPGVGDVELVLTEVLTLLSWAQEPLAQQTIIDILVQTRSAPQSGQFVHEFSQLVNKVLEFGHTTLVQRTTPEGEWGWTLYHDSFREFLRTSERVKMTRRYMQHALLTWCAQWQTHKSPYALRHYAEHLREANEVAQLYALARDEAFAQAQIEGVPNDPDLPRQTAALALQAAIEREDVPTMAEMLLLHARRVETIENPLEALRAGNPQRALKLAERILREQNYQIGTLWLLLLARESCIRENGAEFATQCLNQIRDWWHANRPQPLSDDWAPVVVKILLQFPCAHAAELAVILQDSAKADLVRGLLESGLCPLDDRVEQALAAAERIEEADKRSRAYGAVALALARARKAKQAQEAFQQALAAAERIEWADRRSEAYGAVVKALAQAGQAKQALEVARQIKDSDSRWWAFRAVAEALAQAGQAKQALEAARQIEDAWWRSEAFRAVAVALAQAGQAKQALEVARQIKDSDSRWWAFYEVVKALAQAGQFEQALEVAQQIEDASKRSGAFCEVVKALAQAGQAKQALEVARQIKDSDSRWWAFYEVVKALAQAGQFEQALEVARQIEDSDSRWWAFYEVVKALAQAGQFEQALEVAQQIEDAWRRSKAFHAVALALAQAGQAKQALEAARQIKDAWWRSEAFRAVAVALARAGQAKQALEVAGQIEDAWWRSNAFRAVALALAQAGQAKQALEVAGQIEDSDSRWRAFCEVALALAQAGQTEQALEVAQQIEDAWRRSEAFCEVAVALAQAGQAKQALEAARQIKDAWWRSEAFRAVAVALAQAGQFEQALEVARQIEDSDSRWWAFCEVALALAQAGQFEQALEVARQIEDSNSRSKAFCEVAEALAQAGQAKQALEAARQIEDARRRSEAFREVVKALAQAGQAEQALEVARQIKDSDIRWWAVYEVVKALAQAGQAEQALELARQIKDSDSRWWAVYEVVKALAQAGQAKQALELARQIKDSNIRWGAVCEVVKALAQAGQAEQALELARQIKDSDSRWWAVYQVALALAQAGQAKQALEVARQIKDSNIRLGAVYEVVKALAQAGQAEQALAAAERIEEADERSWAYRAVALAFAKEGDTARAIETLKRALEAANEIRNPSSRYSTVWEIARVTAEIGAGELAQQLVLYELPVGRGEKLPAIMNVLAQRGDTATFLALLPLCGWSRVMAVNACLSLPRLYPQRNLAVLNVLVNELNIGGTEHSDGEVI
jgi:tetratricopeptide (TPR) repeat protein